jgi:hypothetical protein
MALCNLIEVHWCYRGVYCLYHQGIFLMMEAVRTSETSLYFYETTQVHIPEGSGVHTPRDEKFKPHI